MSNLNELKRLENDMKASEELAKKLDDACKRIAGEGKVQNDGELMVAAAKELGYDITIAALEQAKAEAENLDAEELEAVAGGVDNRNQGKCKEGANFLCTFVNRGKVEDEYGHDAWCWTAWHCWAATLQTETNESGITCWKDYYCVLVNNMP